MPAHQGFDSITSVTVNRRDILRTATGLAAAAVVGSALIDGPQLVQAQGKEKDAGFNAQIDGFGQFSIRSFSWGMTNPDSSGGAGQAQVGDAIIVKALDALTHRLQFAVARGEHFQRAIVSMPDVTGTETVTYEFQDVIITGDQVDTSSGETPTERLTLEFRRVVMLHGEQGFEWNVSSGSGRLIP